MPSRGERQGEGKAGLECGNARKWLPARAKRHDWYCKSKRRQLLIPQSNLEFATVFYLYGMQPGGGGNLNNRKSKITVGTRQKELMETDQRCSAYDLSLHMKDR